MADHGSRRRPATRTDAPADAGAPSSRATDRLASQFAAELGLTRAAWDDALRRSDDRWRQDDAAGLVESLEDQRQLLRLLEDRLCAVVSSAAVEREAERVVGSALDQTIASRPPAPAAVTPRTGMSAAGGAGEAGPTARRGSRAHALAGAGAAVAVTMIAIALGVTLGLGAPPVPEVAAPAPDTAADADGVPEGDFDHVVAIADHYAVSSIDLSAASTNWLQVLRALDLGTVAIDPPAEDAATRDDAVADPDPAPETERPGQRETSSAAPSDNDRADRGADEADTSEREKDPTDDRESDDRESDEDEAPGLLDLGDLGGEEETSLPGVEFPLP